MPDGVVVAVGGYGRQELVVIHFSEMKKLQKPTFRPKAYFLLDEKNSVSCIFSEIGLLTKPV